MPEVYGFSVEVSGNAVKSITAIDSSLHKLDADAKRDVANIEGSFSRMGSKLKGMFSGMGGLIGAGTGLGFLFGGVSLAKSSLEAFDKRQESLAKLGAVLQSTGNAAGLTAEGLEKMAGVQSKGQLFSKSSIEDAQSMLLTFTQIKGKIFDQAMPVIGDFATRFKMELPAAAMMVGKALNNPLTGMTRLQRQGVMFSEQQKEQIKNFMAVGDTASAQGVILGELQKEFGGLAEAMTKTDAGKLKQATKALEEMKLGIGKLVTEGLAKLEPVITGIGTLFHKVFGTDLSKDMEDSRLTMNAMFEALKDSNVPFDQRRDIMNQLNSEYGKYLPFVLTEKMSIEDIGAAQAKSNQLMFEKIKIQVATEAEEKAAGALKKAAEKYEQMAEFAAKVKAGDYAHKDILGIKGLSADIGVPYAEEQAKIALDILHAAQSDFDKQMKLLTGIGFGGGTSLGSRSLSGMQSSISDYMTQQMNKGLNLPTVGGAPGAIGANAINTSLLGGASGGLGEAKTIKIDFHKALMEINVPGGNGQDIINKAPMTVEMLLRVLNNLALSQGSTM